MSMTLNCILPSWYKSADIPSAANSKPLQKYFQNLGSVRSTKKMTITVKDMMLFRIYFTFSILLISLFICFLDIKYNSVVL